ncbi:MAG: glycoside hydrolase family 2 TIM barrel-domain containing protein [Rikenellaceae bacterium]
MRKFYTFLVAILALSSHLEAREVIAINDNWRFYFSSENSADYARTISLPHTWDYDQSSSIILAQPSMGNYIREIYAPQQWSGKRIFIKFYGVHNVADISVNGRYVGEHRGGSTAFTFELTPFITLGQSNRVHVMVNDAPQNDVLPTSHEEDLYGGIYRDVELIITEKTAISPLYYGSDGVFVQSEKVSDELVEGVVKVHLNSSQSSTCQLTVAAFDAEGNVVFQKSVGKAKISDSPAEVPFSIASPKLWSPDSANLYRFEVTASDSDASDEVVVTTGFRSIDVPVNGQLLINGVSTPFRSVALYHDYPHVGGAATRRDIDSDMAFIEEIGANAIRSASRPHHPYLYELCDQQGKMVWIDFPLIKAPFLSDVAYFPTEAFHEQGRETMREIIAQNYNHPSVVMWGVFSLLTTRGDNSLPYIKELNSLAKQLDPSRPTVAVSDQDGAINTITDLIVWNQTIGWDRGHFTDIDMWSNSLHTQWSNMRSAVIYGQNGRIDQQAEPSGYKSTNQYNAATWKPEGRQRLFHEEYSKRILPDSLFWGVCINTMFDFKSSRNALGENNSGLVTFDRRDRKDIFYLYKAHWNPEDPTLHIADSRRLIASNATYTLTVYASDSVAKPMLYTRTDTVALERVAPWQYQAKEITLDAGRNKLVVRQGELADSVTVILETPATSSRSTFSFAR